MQERETWLTKGINFCRQCLAGFTRLGARWRRFTLEITGLAGTLGSALLRAGRAVSWEALAEQLWPEDAAIRRRQTDWTEVDEKRFRNRWDQQLATLRAFGGDLRPGGLLRVEGGEVSLVLRAGDILRTT